MLQLLLDFLPTHLVGLSPHLERLRVLPLLLVYSQICVRVELSVRVKLGLGVALKHFYHVILAAGVVQSLIVLASLIKSLLLIALLRTRRLVTLYYNIFGNALRAGSALLAVKCVLNLISVLLILIVVVTCTVQV